MELETIMQYFVTYGPIAIYVIVLLEYMNLPGFPAGVIMPLAGIWAARGGLSFFMTMIITVAAGLTGSVILYALGRGGGEMFLKKYYKKFPSQKEMIEGKMQYRDQQTAADGADDHLDSGGDDPDGFPEVCGQLHAWHCRLESGFCRCWISVRRFGTRVYLTQKFKTVVFARGEGERYENRNVYQ